MRESEATVRGGKDEEEEKRNGEKRMKVSVKEKKRWMRVKATRDKNTARDPRLCGGKERKR